MILRARGRAKLPELRRTAFERVLREPAGPFTFILFDGGNEDERLTAEALAAAQPVHADRMRVFRAPAAEFADYIDQQTAAKKAYDAYDFQRRPCVGVYRDGRLITTFSPRKVFYDPRQQARETREQLEIFIRKFCAYDPQNVREQTNIAEAMKHEAEARAKPAAAKETVARGAGAKPAAGAAREAAKAAPAKQPEEQA